MKTRLIICLQHSKAVPGDHDLNRVGDAIVIGLRNASGSGVRRHLQAILSCSARRPDKMSNCIAADPAGSIG
jgi:hypothetical protein